MPRTRRTTLPRSIHAFREAPCCPMRFPVVHDAPESNILVHHAIPRFTRGGRGERFGDSRLGWIAPGCGHAAIHDTRCPFRKVRADRNAGPGASAAGSLSCGILDFLARFFDVATHAAHGVARGNERGNGTKDKQADDESAGVFHGSSAHRRIVAKPREPHRTLIRKDLRAGDGGVTPRASCRKPLGKKAIRTVRAPPTIATKHEKPRDPPA